MTVLCCYTKLHPATEKALTEHAPDAVLTDVSGNQHNYWIELEKYWGDPEDLIIIEHDIEITADTIQSFEACDSDWCVFPYQHDEEEHPRRLTMSLGCTKLSERARQVASPENLCRVHVDCFVCHMGVQYEQIPACWQHIDAKLAAWLEHNNIHPCIHEPDVIHHGTWKINADN